VRRPDTATLISGLAVMALGTVLLLDQAGSLSLDFGFVLLVGGLAKRDGA
jgi:hypothetical protein